VDHKYFVYIVTNWNNKVIYIGVTNNIVRRTYEHRNKLIEGFTKKYNLNKLVYFEEFSDIKLAISREKELKKWRREKKNKLVERMNKDWEDLSRDFI
jgi:putative endonuclease